jgi:carbon-monoxide dehydrogenase medium subunit
VVHNCPHRLLAQAANLVATPGIRNLSSLWGAVVARSGPPEIILALLALEAQVVILGKGESRRDLPFQEFHAGLPGSLARGELLYEIILPPQGECTGSLERIARTPRDEAILAAITLMQVEGSTVARVSLAVAGAHSLPRRLLDVEKILTGKPFDPALLKIAAEKAMAGTELVGDFRGSGEYRRAMAGLVVRRALSKAWNEAVKTGLGVERGAQ